MSGKHIWTEDEESVMKNRGLTRIPEGRCVRTSNGQVSLATLMRMIHTGRPWKSMARAR